MRLAEPKLFELNPNSIVEVFSVIKDFVEFDLNKLKGKRDLNSIFCDPNYSAEEKFYIANYLPKYLIVENKKTYIYKRIKEIEEIGDAEDIGDIVKRIKENADDLIGLCNTNKKKFKRIYNYSLKSNLIINEIEGSIFEEIRNWRRLPLNKENKQDFIKFVHRQLKPFYPKEDIQDIIENSFEIMPFHNAIALLNFEMENSEKIRFAFYRIYEEYAKRKEVFKDIADNNEVKRLKPKNQQLSKDSKFKRADFYPQLNKNEYGNATAKINIAKIMFLTFSKIRENYLIDSKAKNKFDLNSYLKTYCRDIKK